MARMRVQIAPALSRNFQVSRIDRNPDELIVRRSAPSNCRLQREKIRLSTDVDKLVRNSPAL
jgi:hypothetical protein